MVAVAPMKAAAGRQQRKLRRGDERENRAQAPHRSKLPAHKDRPADCAAAPENPRPQPKVRRLPQCPAGFAASRKSKMIIRYSDGSSVARPIITRPRFTAKSTTEIGTAPTFIATITAAKRTISREIQIHTSRRSVSALIALHPCFGQLFSALAAVVR